MILYVLGILSVGQVCSSLSEDKTQTKTCRKSRKMLRIDEE